MHQKCLQNGIVAKKEDIRALLLILDKEGVAARRSRRLKRREYSVKGPNYLWHLDSYDKLKPYGICINGCIDGFSRKIIWMKAYSTSSDPKIIGGYFVEAIKDFGGCPRIVRADRGTENTIVAEIQRYIRRNGADPLAGDKSFLLGRSVCNQRIEAWWSILRKEFTDFWLTLFRSLKDEGNFDGHFIDTNLSVFCFLGLIQVID